MEETLKKDLYRIAIRLYPQGISQNNVWKRSGGDVSFIFLGQSGRDTWFEALERLAKGGGGSINYQKLLCEMLSDFPEDSDLIKFDKDYQSEIGATAVLKIPSLGNEMEFPLEEQDWFVKDFPKTIDVTSQELSELVSAIQIVVFTVTDVELKYALSYLKPVESAQHIIKGVSNSETYYAGEFGAFKAVITKCQMGTTGTGSATLASEEGLRFWEPNFAFMVGIAFGKDSSKQHVGQVLIANSVIPYESQRLGSTTISRGTPLSSDHVLLNRFEHSYDWKFVLPNGDDCRKEVGPLLSGEKLVDNLEYKNSLFSRHPNAIGGEMEGAGFYAAAQRKRIPCILLKSICDWADGQKHKKYQPLAAATASSLLYHILSKKDLLDLNQISKEKSAKSNFLGSNDKNNALASVINNYRNHLSNHAQLSAEDVEDFSLIAFLRLVEIEIAEKQSVAEWKKYESMFHRIMKRGPTSGSSNDESENQVKHNFVNIARKNYLKARATSKNSEMEFEDLWKAVKDSYRKYYE